jgi:iron complex transport system substrate-binding protein
MKMKRTISAILLLTLLLTLTSACAPSGEPDSTGQSVSFTDSCGRTVTLPGVIEKIAVTGPMAQIVLFSLAPDRLVGLAGDWSEAEGFIEEKYLRLPVLGQLYGTRGELNLEQLLSAAPDVVIDVGEPKESVAADMDTLQEQTGLPFVHIDADAATMGEAYRKLGELLSLPDEAEALAQFCDRTYSNAAELMEKLGADNKVSLVYLLGEQGLNVIAAGSYHAQVLDMMGANAAVLDNPSSGGTGSEIDLEQLYIWNPQVIIFAPGSIYDTVAADENWRQIDAIASGNYYEVPAKPYNWFGFPPSVQRCLGMLWLGALLYPDDAVYDLKEDVTQFYELFYHCELTDAQYDELTARSVPY